MRVRETRGLLPAGAVFRRIVLRGFPLAGLLTVSGVARAEIDQQASEFFRAGEVSYARGDFPAAARSFEEAHRRAPHGATLYNAGLAWEWAQQPGRAADDYEAALKLGGLGAQQTADATARLSALEKSLGHINVVAPRGGTVSVAHLDQATIPVIVHATPGEHEVRSLHRGGQDEITKVMVAVGRSSEVTFAAAPQSQPRTATPEAVADRAPVAVSPSRRRAWGWGTLGASVGLGGVAIYLGVQALGARDTYNQSGYTDLGAYDRASTLRTWTNVFWVGAGLAAATGAVLLLGDSGSDSRTASAAPRTSVALGPAGVVVITSF